MSIGLSRHNIESRIEKILLDELNLQIGLESQQKIATAIAKIIIDNNSKIEDYVKKEIQNATRYL